MTKDLGGNSLTFEGKQRDRVAATAAVPVLVEETDEIQYTTQFSIDRPDVNLYEAMGAEQIEKLCRVFYEKVCDCAESSLKRHSKRSPHRSSAT